MPVYLDGGGKPRHDRKRRPLTHEAERIWEQRATSAACNPADPGVLAAWRKFAETASSKRVDVVEPNPKET